LLISSSRYIIYVLAGGNMPNGILEINESFRLYQVFHGYSNPSAKIRNLVKKGNLIQFRRGLYIRPDCLEDPRWRMRIANRLYGPSYISLQYALRWWGLIPENVPHITSVTFRKNRNKRFETPAGTYFYRDVPREVYPHSVVLESSGHPRFLIASAEKALCDLLYTISGIRSARDLEALLFEDLRIEDGSFNDLNPRTLFSLSALYGTETLFTFSNYLKRRYPEAYR
jgi:hypothetical protein